MANNFIGYIECKEKKGYDVYEAGNTSKAVYNDYGGGHTSKSSQTYKAGEFVDGRSGREGFREEVNYKSTHKYNDKAQGVTTDYETQVKFKKTTTYDNKSSHKNLKYY